MRDDRDDVEDARAADAALKRGQVRFAVCKACGRRGLVLTDRSMCIVETINVGPKGPSVRGTRPERCKRAEVRRAA